MTLLSLIRADRLWDQLRPRLLRDLRRPVQVAAREARLLLETRRKLSHGYEHLTEVLADVLA
jgi:hypothetical protein